ncbi:(2Fe-2S)-binding protein [Microbacterium invictum]|uniref:Molibdopterin-dependent oxidoreductase YjgC n=1 Tax=Microbacterium invictum TaxID=515415 RepID=A0AA40SPI9_9MICO|nr:MULTISPECIES: (2Fe-2S)-binding protein [Microbacterium]MBB4139971.1 putative molibdopterin-dependent oxidoreductase YjgC [Microbacterium invictum]
MTAYLRDHADDPAAPRRGHTIGFTLDGEPATAIEGQTIAGAILSTGRTSWRTTAVGAEPRGVFCGIGVCFDCIVTVGETRDVRACLRRVREGDEVCTQHDRLPDTHEEARA